MLSQTMRCQTCLSLQTDAVGEIHLAGDDGDNSGDWWYSEYSYGCDKEYYQNSTRHINGTIIVTQALF